MARHRAQTRLKMSTKLSNLSRRLPKPALGNGRVQVQCKRAFMAFDREISTSEAVSWAFPRADKRPDKLSRSVRHALASIGAQRIGRAKTIGRPWLWAPPLPLTLPQ